MPPVPVDLPSDRAQPLTDVHDNASGFPSDRLCPIDLLDGNDDEPIVICGLSIKFPQDALTPESFWGMLAERRCATTDFPPSRLALQGFHHEHNQPNTIPLRGGHFIAEDLSLFDADFFSISPAEAAAMDPMQRWLLEVAYRALENAGITMEKASGSATGVYTGSFGYDYMTQLYRDREDPPKYAAVGVGLSMLANRLSWFYNLRGPSIALDTACSSAATALDIACQALKSRACEMCLVAGCNLTFAPEVYTTMSNVDFLSPDSRCFSFDERANGYSRGEGIAVLVLKRLSDAIRDGNMIRAVIRATGLNEDGKTPGITQPSREAQEHLIRETYRRAGLSMQYTRYFEAHGTGTPIGDPREAQAIGSAFREFRSSQDPLYVGAVKSNIGHLEGASGLAGVVKAVMALEKGIIPPNTNFETLNPKIDAQYLRLKFPTQCHPWPTPGLRRASVNSFGYGGANAHVVLDDAYNYLRLRSISGPHCTNPGTEKPCTLTDDIQSLREGRACTGRAKLLVWSSSDREGIHRLAQAYSNYDWRRSNQSPDKQVVIDNLAYTLDTCRTKLSWRSYALLNSVQDLTGLPSLLTAPVQARVQPPRIAYVFTGQGAQWYAMGRELLQYSTFSETLQRAGRYLRSIGCPWDVIEELSKSPEASKIDQPIFSQTLTTVLQTAIVDLLTSFGLRPRAVLGHSSGEIAAAYAGGHVDEEFAWKLAYHRGCCSQTLVELAHECGSGAMLAVGLSEADARSLLATFVTDPGSFDLAIACVNSPSSVTISGDKRLIYQLHEELKNQGVFSRPLRVDVAYHSDQMKQISERYQNLIGEGSRAPTASVIMISTVTGERVTPETLQSPKYWVDNMISPVQFAGAVSLMCAEAPENNAKKIDGSHRHKAYIDLIIEIGPHAALKGSIREITKMSRRQQPIEYLSVLKRGQSSLETTLQLVGELHCLGLEVNLRAANEPVGDQSRSLLVDLPEYPFDHSRGYWHEGRLSRNYRMRRHPPSDLLGVRSDDWNPLEARWRHFIRTTDIPWIEQHVVNGSIIYPAAGMLVMAIEASRQLALDNGKPVSSFSLRDVQFKSAMLVKPGSQGLEVQTSLRSGITGEGTSSTYDFAIYSFVDEGCVVSCQGIISVEYNIGRMGTWETERSSIQQDLLIQKYKHDEMDYHPVESGLMYRLLQQTGLSYGPDFQVLEKQLFTYKQHAAADVPLHKPSGSRGPRECSYQAVIHPISLDAIFHPAFTALSCGGSKPLTTSIPTHLENLWLTAEGLSWSKENSVRSMVNIDHISKSGFSSSALVTSTGSRPAVRLWFDGLHMTDITERPPLGPKLPNPRQSYMGVDCKPALDMMSPDEVRHLLQVRHRPKTSISGISRTLEELVHLTLARLVSSPGIDDLGSALSWKRHYLSWAHHHLKHLSLPDDDAYPKNNTHPKSRLGAENSVENSYGATGRVYERISENILAIFHDEVSTFDLILKDDLFSNMYNESFHQNCCARQISTYIDLLAHQRPGMKILELGAGTGAGTRLFIDALRGPSRAPDDPLRCDRYHFTDISPTTFVSMKEEFKNHAGQMVFGNLDMELDFARQGFQHGQYDLVLAASVLHVTSNLENTMRNVRKALKTGGKLVIQEVFETAGWTLGFVFGLLPGWWLGVDENRILSPNITKHQWDTLLRKTGFSGIDIGLDDTEQATVSQSGWIISTAIEDTATPISQPQVPAAVVIVLDDESAQQKSLCRELLGPIHSMVGSEPTVSTLQEFSSRHLEMRNDLAISLLDYGSPLFKRLNERTWKGLQAMIRTERRVLWISSGGGHPVNPDFGVLDGLARTWRSEHFGLHLVTLGLERGHSEARSAAMVTSVLEKVLEKPSSQNYEEEFIEVDGVLHTRRLVDASSVKLLVNARLVSHQPYKAQLKNLNPFIFASSPSCLDMPQFLEMDASKHTPTPGSVIHIMVRAVSLQAWERTSTSGSLSDSVEMGRFCTGFVLQSPSDSPFRAGDRVCVDGRGLLCSKLWVRPNQIKRLPSDLSYTDACARIQPMLTAYSALARILPLRRSCSILVEEAASPIGKALITLLKDCGFSEIWATAWDEEESLRIQQDLNLPSENVLPKTWFRSGTVLSSRWKHSFDVLVGVEQGPPVSRFMECLKSTGQFILFKLSSNQGIQGTHSVGSTVISTSVILVDQLQETLDLPTAGAMDQILRLCSSRSVKDADYPGYGTATFPASGIKDALACLELAESPEAVIVEFDNMDEIEINVPVRPSYQLSSEATYIVAGGLGGLGRSLARWLVARGARNLILLSRSGPVGPDAIKLLKELEAVGARLEAPKCDITSREALAKVLTDCSKTMPPIKGCIQATMEAIFEKVKLEDFRATLDPKVTGSWNLHTELPTDLDFFVLMSSIAGIIGRISLAAYNAGNTYQDALAHHRVAIGLSGLSIDLGAVEDEGHLLGRQDLVSGYQRTLPIETLHTKEIYALLDAHLETRVQASGNSHLRKQVIIGVRPPSHWKHTDDIPFTMSQPFWRHMHHIPLQLGDTGDTKPDQTSASSITQRLATTRTESEVLQVICTALAQRISSLLGTSEEKIEPEKALHGYGLDSLSAVELRNWIGKTFDVDISLFDILGEASIRSTGLTIARKRTLYE
ncbi:putative polyketide synthase [Poronia punctata]|nr:putative polyketide synthase [Poronia punctata]